MTLSYQAAKTLKVLVQPQGDGWQVLYTDATPPQALLEVQRVYGRALALHRLDEAAFEQALQQHFAQQADTLDTLQSIEVDEDLHSVAAQLSETLDLLSSENDAPVVRLLNAILADAVRAHASDVHIEPYEQQLRIRQRIDGQLHTVLTLDPRLAPMLIARVKVLAHLDIAEKRLPQDGRIALQLGGHQVDLRVSTLPSSHGERAVLRLLDKSQGLLSLDQLGMPPEVRNRFEQLLRHPHGVILVTGPTGSGKTTTLYAALSWLNDSVRNIMTIEDPVEYNLPGISQTQINPRAGMTFAKGLRAMLRQDPDVVMVGEIRDPETAEIAMQAALTGHLVLSTLHTNTALGAITRLRDMGVEPFLLASGLTGVMAQRLVRRLCPYCKASYTLESDLPQLALSVGTTLYRPVGCEKCRHTGYLGRRALYELIPIDETLEAMIHAQAPEQQLAEYAHERYGRLQEHARAVLLAGEVSVDEVQMALNFTVHGTF